LAPDERDFIVDGPLDGFRPVLMPYTRLASGEVIASLLLSLACDSGEIGLHLRHFASAWPV
jgi:hypothetical protein